MPTKLYYVLAILACAVLAAAVTNGPKDENPSPPAGITTDDDIHVPPPPFSEDIFPCSECHDPEDEVDTERRELMAHEDIVLRHDEENRWCLDCHDAVDRDVLRLASGAPVPFEESYRLCGQCHGEKLRDWKAGVHGKRTGSWDGQKTYLLCAHCHNPHSPAFQKLPPLPAPIRPDELYPSYKKDGLPEIPAVILNKRLTPARAGAEDQDTTGLADQTTTSSPDQVEAGENH